ncbi:MAG: UbiD family decarboxylase, partial [Bacteroidota bacterium]|nr:UbiD family decarboxylase [Bacteroidota bacterium]
KNLTGMHWHKHKVGARHYKEYKELNKKIPIAVALGGDPAYTYCATAPMPDNTDEYLLAGFIRKKGVKLVNCISQNIKVPADADIIIEGYVDPSEELIWEGPFGDHTGFYSLADYYPKFHITCITHKKNAIYPATIVGIPPQEDAYLAKATEKIFLPLLQKTIAPEILDMNIPETGVAHNFTIIKMKTQYSGHALKIMSSLWGNGQMALNKCLFVTDDSSIDISNYEELAKKVLKKFNPAEDIFYSKGPIDVLDHASEKFTLGSKIGFDFTDKEKESEHKIDYSYKIDLTKLKKNFPEINNINSLLRKEIPVLFVAINKKEKISSFSEKFIEKTETNNFKIIVFVDNNVNINNIYETLWITGNNIAAKRDTKIISRNNRKDSILIIDATKKTKEIDDFNRIWPKITIMNNKTINTVNENWDKYNIGNFISSPSLKIK